MFKDLGMALAILGAMGNRRMSSHGYYVKPQSPESVKLHVDLAKAKRERKAEKLRAIEARNNVNG
ncbi:hypothetical protein [Rhizobium leguminosarum]|uniref:hypothetical protein n=1 Tax=Rhizobium leguminosarum TaxID=384 RepID=UPI001441C8A7|nr:hypothetical protein [Rhizobium leguminosarum]MBY5863290.1 hypothetical protein [Rhizobium leguminosarum]NKM04169.1 hypothetical protein [Rhizobium leguminosarum bv. viciae]